MNIQEMATYLVTSYKHTRAPKRNALQHIKVWIEGYLDGQSKDVKIFWKNVKKQIRKK